MRAWENTYIYISCIHTSVLYKRSTSSNYICLALNEQIKLIRRSPYSSRLISLISTLSHKTWIRNSKLNKHYIWCIWIRIRKVNNVNWAFEKIFATELIDLIECSIFIYSFLPSSRDALHRKAAHSRNQALMLNIIRDNHIN